MTTPWNCRRCGCCGPASSAGVPRDQRVNLDGCPYCCAGGEEIEGRYMPYTEAKVPPHET